MLHFKEKRVYSIILNPHKAKVESDLWLQNVGKDNAIELKDTVSEELF